MKILLITNMYPTKDRPNYGIFVKEQMDAVTKQFHDIEYDVYYIDKQADRMAYLKSIFKINKLINKGCYDAAHIHYGLSGLFLLFPILRRQKIPVIVTLHGGDIQPEQGKGIQVSLTHKILKKADIAISLNDRMTHLAAQYCNTVHKIPCSVNTDIFIPCSSHKNTTKEKLTVIFPSDRSRTIKNYPLYKAVVEAYEQKYSTVIEQRELKNMSRHDIVKALQTADLMLMTSISEGSPQVVKEAMACNLPVVSTNVGDIETLLAGVKSSLWATSPNVDTLVDCMHRVIKGEINGVTPRKRIFELGLDNNSIASKVYTIYRSIGA